MVFTAYISHITSSLLIGIHTAAATMEIPMKAVQKAKSRAITEFIYTFPEYKSGISAET